MPHELDSGDLDAIRELRGMRGHTLAFIRITETIKRWQLEIEQQDVPETRTHFLRGMIAGLRTAQEIPQILEDEARVNVESEPLVRYQKVRSYVP